MGYNEIENDIDRSQKMMKVLTKKDLLLIIEN
jgi:hypothetical protein